mgnify:CR=1 FL=1
MPMALSFMPCPTIILKMLPQLQSEAKTKEVKDAFKQHEDETREQIDVLPLAAPRAGEMLNRLRTFELGDQRQVGGTVLHQRHVAQRSVQLRDDEAARRYQ